MRNKEIESLIRTDGLSAPVTVTWEVTNRCNLRCAHCLSGSGPEADTSSDLSLAEARGVVDQLAAEGVFQIHFGGGEPFTYPGFMDLLRHAQRRGFCCLCISTNGALLTPARIAELEAMGGIYLQVSMDGADAETCDALRGKGAFQKALAALEKLRDTEIVRTVNMVFCRENAHQLDAMQALAEANNATLRVTRLKPSGRGTEGYLTRRPTQPQLAVLHQWLKDHPDVLTGDTFFHLNALGGSPLPGFSFCGAARMTCLIAPNGDVFPCAFTQGDVFRAGNLRQQDFHAIWNESPVFNSIFRGGSGSSNDSGNPANSGGACKSCDAYEGCGGGCPAVKHAVTGRLDLPDPDCVLDKAQPAWLALNEQPLCAG